MLGFDDRADAGRRLAERLDGLRGEDAVVLGLPCGGVPVAFEVARALRAPLDVVVVREPGAPHRPELDARVEHFRRGRPRVEPGGRTAVVVDDGVVTGATARAACRAARAQGARRVVLAVPVGPPGTIADLRRAADDVVCLLEPDLFYAVGQWYREFGRTSDAEVAGLLDRAADPEEPRAVDEEVPTGEDVWIDGGFVELTGRLTVPARAGGIVAFAHGSGSSRHSPRNRLAAAVFHRAGLGTLLFDLLTAREELDRGSVFDIGLLAGRLAAATAWLRDRPEAPGARVGYYGTSTGAAAALWAAAETGSGIAAVVSRGGRPDLAGRRLDGVRAPTLLIVGEDRETLCLNQRAQRRLRCPNRLTVVPAATHLFEEPEAMRAVTEHAIDWFLAHMR